MTWRRWYNGDVEVDGGAYINLNEYVDDYKKDIIRLFSDEDLKSEIQLREEGKSKQERYIEKLLIYDDYGKRYFRNSIQALRWLGVCSRT